MEENIILNEEGPSNHIQMEKSRIRLYSFLAVLSLFYMPFVLKTLTIIIRQKPISFLIDAVYDFSGIILAVIWGYLITSKMFVNPKLRISCGLYIAGTCLFVELYTDKISAMLAVRTINKMYINWILMVAVILFTVALLALAISKKGVFFRNVLLGIGLIVIYESTAALFYIILKLVKTSFATISVFYIAVSYAASFLITFYIGKNKDQEEKEPSMFHFVFPTILFTVSLVGILCFSLPVSPQKSIGYNLMSSMEAATIQLMAGNTDMAFQSVRNGADRRSEWYKLLNNENELQSLQNSDFMQIKYLVWDRNNDVDAVEESLLNGNYSLDLGKQYLKMTGQNEKETDDASIRELKDRIVKDMIANESFVAEGYSYENIMEHKSQIEEVLDQFGDFDKYKQVLEIIKKEEEGETKLSDVQSLLDIAEENPDDLYLQYLAAVYGVAHPGDQSSTYDDTVQALIRYRNLYQTKYGINKEVTYDVLGKLYLINRYEDILVLIDEEPEPDEVEKQYKAACYLKLNEYDLCEGTAKEIQKENPDDYNALYYLAYTSYAKEERIKSLEFSCRLADRAKELEDVDKELADLELYLMVQLYTAKDSVNPMHVRELNDDEIAILHTNDLLSNYYYASYYCYEKPDAAYAVQYIQNLQKSGWTTSNVYYLEGNIYMLEEDFEDAVISYKMSLELWDSPTTWYALANAYDAIGDYHNAYVASKEGSKYFTSSDHAMDRYGVAIHNKNLLDSLQQKLGEE